MWAWIGNADWWASGAAVASVVFAVLSWWRSDLSAKARKEAAEEKRRAAEAEERAKRHQELAEEASRRAAEDLAEMKRQTLALERLVEQNRQPPVVTRKSGKRWILENTTGEPIRVESIANEELWLRVDVDEGIPFTIPADHGTVSVLPLTAMGRGGAHHFDLQLGDGHVLHVPLADPE